MSILPKLVYRRRATLRYEKVYLAAIALITFTVFQIGIT
jgi:hypothetical protein